MHVPFQLISVFTNAAKNCRGNCSAVIELPVPLNVPEMQRIANDFNQPATTFLWKQNGNWFTRWFAPDAEIGLCGHGTAAAVAYLNASENVSLHYSNGQVKGICPTPGTFSIQLNALPVIREIEIPHQLHDGLDIPLTALFETKNKHILLAGNAEAVTSMQPDFAKLRECPFFGYAVTAQGTEVDFVSRTLVPHVQQLEDHATGSSHAALTPFWANQLKKNELTAHQLSPRGGWFNCSLNGDLVTLNGSYRKLAEGRLEL